MVQELRGSVAATIASTSLPMTTLTTITLLVGYVVRNAKNFHRKQGLINELSSKEISRLSKAIYSLNSYPFLAAANPRNPYKQCNYHYFLCLRKTLRNTRCTMQSNTMERQIPGAVIGKLLSDEP